MAEYTKQSRVYAEVYAVLSLAGSEFVSKIPQNILDVIAEKRDKDYQKEIDENVPLEEQNLSREAIAMLAALKIDYCCETEKEKQELLGLLKLNDEKESGQPLSKDSKSTWINILKNKLKN